LNKKINNLDIERMINLAITMELVKELRAKTGAGILDCQKALKETEGDIEKSIDFLRKKGLAAAAKKKRKNNKRRNSVY